MIKFIFLGINGSLQELDSGNTSLIIKGKEGCAAIDLSTNLSTIIEKDIDAIILTHEHIDHIYALPSVLHQLWISGRSRHLYIYIPEGMLSLINNLIDLFEIREKKNMFDIRINTEKTFPIGSMKITTFPTDHTDVSVGIVVEEGEEKLIFTSDTRPIKKIKEYMRDAQILIHEASGVMENHDQIVKSGHSSGADAGCLANKLNVKKLYLCHLPKGDIEKSKVLSEAKTYFKQTSIPSLLKAIILSEEIS